MDFKQDLLTEVLVKVPIFSKLNPSDLAWVAGLFRPITYYEGDRVFDIGDPPDAFYVIYDGSVVLAYDEDDQEDLIAELTNSDFFGEEALLFDDPRYYQAVSSGTTILLKLSADVYQLVLEKFPVVEAMLDVAIQSRQLAIDVPLSWLHDDEFVHVMMRRHPAILWSRLLRPVLLAAGVGIIALLIQRMAGWIGFSMGMIISIVWMIWSYYDWQNDFFIVTNKRVVWIEKIAFIYESRHEAPLRTIMSVGVQRSRLGSLIGFGDVVVTTYVGTIRLSSIAYTDVTAALIESYWHRSESSNRREESEMMARLLQEKLELPLMDALNINEEVLPVRQESSSSEFISQTKEPGFFGWLFSDFIRLRYEQDGAITYRKHWFVLIKHLMLPVFLMLLAVGTSILLINGLFTFIPITAGLVVFFLVMFIIFLWMIYAYVDWRNDLFIVTLDQIVDLDRKPLGKVHRRSAPLENVLSIEYERIGFWGYLFNYGTVYIIVGNNRLSFDHVYQPAEVQEDIFYRMGERLEKVRQFEIDAERERVSEWIASYHRAITATRDLTKPGRRENPPPA